MVLLTFIVAVLNLSLGFAVAVFLGLKRQVDHPYGVKPRKGRFPPYAADVLQSQECSLNWRPWPCGSSRLLHMQNDPHRPTRHGGHPRRNGPAPQRVLRPVRRPAIRHLERRPVEGPAIHRPALSMERGSLTPLLFVPFSARRPPRTDRPRTCDLNLHSSFGVTFHSHAPAYS